MSRSDKTSEHDFYDENKIQTNEKFIDLNDERFGCHKL